MHSDSDTHGCSVIYLNNIQQIQSTNGFIPELGWTDFELHLILSVF